MKKTKRKAEHTSKNDPFTKAIVERIERALGYLRWRGLEVPDWGELAAAAGLSPSRMAEVRSGDRRLQVGESIQIAQRLGILAGWLLTGEGQMIEGDDSKTLPAVPAETPDFYNRLARDEHLAASTPPATPAGDRPVKHGGKKR